MSRDKWLVCPDCGKALSIEPDYMGYSIACCIDIGDHGQQTGPHAWGMTRAECEDAWSEMLADRDWKNGAA